MKKIYTIGRDPQCDILLVDNTDVTSRTHAVLEIGPGGKYFLTDKSRNGTYVNGMKMASNERIPVSRNDVISFAHAGNLDWTLIPKNHTMLIVWSIVAVLLAVALGLILYFTLSSNKDEVEIPARVQETEERISVPRAEMEEEVVEEPIAEEPVVEEETVEEELVEEAPQQEIQVEEKAPEVDAIY